MEEPRTLEQHARPPRAGHPGDEPEAAAAAVAGPAAPSARERLVVIDDDEDILQALRLILQVAYDVEVAVGGEQGLQACRRCPPSLVLCDLMMPDTNGFEVTRALKQDPRTRHIPIILLTGRGEIRFKLEGFDRGADDYIHKPFESRELLARIRAHLENRRLARELAAKNVELERVLAELREAQARLLENERLRTALSMATALAHEINNPLSGILGFCDLLQGALPDGSAEQRDVATIVQQAGRIAEVVRKIQGFKEVRFVPYVGEETMIDLGSEG